MVSSTSIDSRMSTVVLGGTAILGLSLILAKNPMNMFVMSIISGTYEKGAVSLSKTLYDSPVIALSLATGFGINQALSKWAPGFSLLAGYEGSLKVAQFVGASFLLKSALNPFLEKVITRNQELHEKYLKIHHVAVRYLVPLAISTVALRSYGFPVKSIPGALLTASIFGGINLLGIAYRKSIDIYDNRRTYSWYSKLPTWLQY